jgi:hypothetical protein
VTTQPVTANLVPLNTTADAVLFDEAIASGMTPEQAGRWVAYVKMKHAAGEQPITLERAVVQLRIAQQRASIAKATAALASVGQRAAAAGFSMSSLAASFQTEVAE